MQLSEGKLHTRSRELQSLSSQLFRPKVPYLEIIILVLLNIYFQESVLEHFGAKTVEELPAAITRAGSQPPKHIGICHYLYVKRTKTDENEQALAMTSFCNSVRHIQSKKQERQLRKAASEAKQSKDRELTTRLMQ